MLAIIVIAGIIYLYNQTLEKEYEKGVKAGQDEVAKFVIKEIQTNGRVNLYMDNNQTMTLIPSGVIQLAQEDLVKQIMNEIQTKGYVQIYNNETQIILVPYIPSKEEAELQS